MIYVAFLAFIALVSGKDRCTKITDIAKCESTLKCQIEGDLCVMEDKQGKKMKKWIEFLTGAGADVEELEGMDYDGLKKAAKALKKMMKKWMKMGCDKEVPDEEEGAKEVVPDEKEDGDKKKYGYAGYGLGHYGYPYYGRRLECGDFKKWYGHYGYGHHLGYRRRVETSE